MTLLRWLANGVAVFHGLFCLTAVTLTVLALLGVLRRHPRLEKAFLAAVLLMGGSIAILNACFLTLLEQRLRLLAAPETAFNEGFIEHYLRYVGLPVTGAGVTRTSVTVVVVAVLATVGWHVLDIIRRRAQTGPDAGEGIGPQSPRRAVTR